MTERRSCKPSSSPSASGSVSSPSSTSAVSGRDEAGARAFATPALRLYPADGHIWVYIRSDGEPLARVPAADFYRWLAEDFARAAYRRHEDRQLERMRRAQAGARGINLNLDIEI